MASMEAIADQSCRKPGIRKIMREETPMRHKRPLILAALLLCAVLPGRALAADTGEPTPFYPSEIVEYGEETAPRLDKIYNLAATDDPAGIPTEDFEREGFHYTLLDLIRQEQTVTDAKPHTETVTLDSKSKDMNTILPMLDPTCEVTTEDEYTGILTLDTASIKVEAAGYGKSTKNVSATRTYPNLSDADTSFIPKTIEDSGRTLTLGDVQWSDGENGYFTATATYTGTATSTYATGYTVTANYTGEVSKTTTDTVVYRATFGGTPLVPVGEEAEETQMAQSSIAWDWNWYSVLAVAGGAAGLTLLGVLTGLKLSPKKEWRELTE